MGPPNLCSRSQSGFGMRDASLICGAFACVYLGFAWLALAMQAHRVQVLGSQAAHHHTPMVLRLLGSTALVASLGLCLTADTAAMADLVWPMVLAAGAVAVAFTLAWRPRWLRRLALRRWAE